jgi:LmbE family N-acetylglucosaminyl deacetylase
MTKTVLIIAAHSDDEALGCAGTLVKHIAHGDKVHAVFMTNGVGARSAQDSKDIQDRQTSAYQASAILNLSSVSHLDFPDNAMDTVSLLTITQEIESIITQTKPEIIYTHHYGDLNIDHRLTHQAVVTACRPIPGSTIKEIYAFEVLSSTEWQTPGHTPFIPDVYQDISSYFSEKLKVIDAYKEEMREAPHSRSIAGITALAQHRGHSIGVDYAEAFKLVRLIK